MVLTYPQVLCHEPILAISGITSRHIGPSGGEYLHLCGIRFLHPAFESFILQDGAPPVMFVGL